MDMDEESNKEEQLEHEIKSQKMDANKSGPFCLDKGNKGSGNEICYGRASWGWSI